MRCPVDKNDMIVVEYKGIEVDYCLQCKGVWFDSDELDLLISMLASGGENASPPGSCLTPRKAETHESPRKCPICLHKMDKVWTCDRSNILIDSCPLGDGLWFDGGELRQVLHQLGHTNTEGIVSFLGEMLEADTN
jgi:Zn-finger nucleic acid-binding protein